MENQTVNVELNVNQVNLVLAALRELPHRTVNDLINSIVEQAETQLQRKDSPE